METILIFGGFGFLGSNVIDYALQNHLNDYKFIVFDIYEQHPSGKSFKNVAKIYKGDFTNREDINIVFKENKIDYVFHFISTTVPANSNNNIRYDIESNLISTINMLDTCKSYPIKSIFFISSGGAVYGDSTQYIHKESDNLNPNSSYGIIKLTIEKYLKLYNHLYNLNYLCLRLANPYGAFHLSQKQGLINIAIKKAISKQEFEVWGDGSNVKDYIYAEDVARIIFTLVKRKIVNQVLNVGTNKGYAVNEILGIIKKLVPSFTIKYKEQKSFDVPKVVLNTEAIVDYIDFELTSLEQGINKTFTWTKRQKNKPL
ncbi:MAG: NAD-dependent epimerase/dehydratase family protein [Parafilimonas sp.]